MTRQTYPGKPHEQHDNIVVVGYPKSGTIWLSTLLADVLDCPSCGHVFYRLNHAVSIEGLDRESNRRVWKSHGPPRFLVKDPIKTSRVVYVVRDVRDVICSLTASFLHHRGDKSGGFEASDKDLRRNAPDVLRLVTLGKPFEAPWSRGVLRPVWYTSWQYHVFLWDKQDVLFVKYEDLLDDTEKAIKGILQHLDIKAAPEHIRQSVHDQSFAIKKKKLRSGPASRKMRKGKWGTFKTVLTKDMLDLVEKRCARALRMLKYDLLNGAS